jgi:hypothetical protein
MMDLSSPPKIYIPFYMAKFIEVFVIFILAIIIVMYLVKHYGEVEYVRASDNREYLVRNLSDKQEAAQLLADVTRNMQHLVQHMCAKYPEDPRSKQLYENFNPSSISEGSPDSGYTSYSVNKGEKIILCLRQKDGKFVKINTILYVAIHELGHLMTSDIGHTDAFWKNFKFLLNEAIFIKIYTKEDYHTEPQDYCGIKINNSVLI